MEESRILLFRHKAAEYRYFDRISQTHKDFGDAQLETQEHCGKIFGLRSLEVQGVTHHLLKNNSECALHIGHIINAYIDFANGKTPHQGNVTAQLSYVFFC